MARAIPKNHWPFPSLKHSQQWLEKIGRSQLDWTPSMRWLSTISTSGLQLGIGIGSSRPKGFHSPVCLKIKTPSKTGSPCPGKNKHTRPDFGLSQKQALPSLALPVTRPGGLDTVALTSVVRGRCCDTSARICRAKPQNIIILKGEMGETARATYSAEGPDSLSPIFSTEMVPWEASGGPTPNLLLAGMLNLCPTLGAAMGK